MTYRIRVFLPVSHHHSNFCLLSSPTSSSHWLSIPHSVSTSTNMPRCLVLLVPFLLNGSVTSRSLFKCGLPWKSFLKLYLSLPTHPDPLSSSLVFSLSLIIHYVVHIFWLNLVYYLYTMLCVCVCVCVCVSCSVVSHSATPMDYSPPGFSVHGVLQARILEWVATAFSRGSSQPRDQTHISCIAGIFFTIWAIREAPCCGQCKIHMYKHTSILLICWIRYIQNSVSGTK